jgi:N-acetylglucosaminyldiphosphoundecaprenol N-acetyl-beta-D-mannosaminyltransferase
MVPVVGNGQVTTAERRTVVLDGVTLHACTEREVVSAVVDGSVAGKGGWVVTPNVDIMRALRRDRALHDMVGSATLVVPDGMPLLWAARLRGTPLPQRVTGASLIWSISAAAAASGRSVYLLGGAPGVPEAAAKALAARCRGLQVVGTDSPPMGFDDDPALLAPVLRSVADAAPDIVFCGLGFPRQERLIVRLREVRPEAWYVGCGAAIPFAAGAFERAPQWMQRTGLEWVHRLVTEPRRLVRRYLVDDLPYAGTLLARAALDRVRRRTAE